MTRRATLETLRAVEYLGPLQIIKHSGKEDVLKLYRESDCTCFEVLAYFEFSTVSSNFEISCWLEPGGPKCKSHPFKDPTLRILISQQSWESFAVVRNTDSGSMILRNVWYGGWAMISNMRHQLHVYHILSLPINATKVQIAR